MFVEEGEGAAALGSELVGLVEDGGDSALLCPGQQWKARISDYRARHSRVADSCRTQDHVVYERWRPNPVEEKPRAQDSRSRSKDREACRGNGPVVLRRDGCHTIQVWPHHRDENIPRFDNLSRSGGGLRRIHPRHSTDFLAARFDCGQVDVQERFDVLLHQLYRLKQRSDSDLLHKLIFNAAKPDVISRSRASRSARISSGDRCTASSCSTSR